MMKLRIFLFLWLTTTFVYSLAAQCTQGDCRNGNGVYTFKSGARFEGEFRNGAMYQGTYYYANGDIYQGSFNKNKRHGKGQYNYQDGSTFTGEYEYGKKKKGIFQYNDGSRYEGEFKDGKRHGYGKQTSADGSVYEGYWENNRFLGKNPNNPVTTYAVVVGISDYNNFEPGSGDLNFSDADAERFYHFLLSQQMGHVKEEHVSLLTNSKASKKNILHELGRLFALADDNDRIIFYYSGHGDRNMFLPSDVNPNAAATSVLYHDEVKEAFRNSNAQYKLIIADACYSGSFRKDIPSQNKATSRQDNTPAKHEEIQVAVMVSSTDSETSCEHTRLRQGVFSYYLLLGLRGEADANNDAIVNIEELYYFVRNNAYLYSKENCSSIQRPILYGHFDRNMPVSYATQ